jgi:hypothetical protein
MVYSEADFLLAVRVLAVIRESKTWIHFMPTSAPSVLVAGQ